MSTPRVSIIIPAHGHEGMTRACVDSVLHSDATQVGTEVIVVDDASPSPLAMPDNEAVRVVRSNTNLGFSAACNLGASEASGEFLLFLNNDVLVRGGWLHEMLDCATMDDTVQIVGARLLYGDGTTQHAGIVFSQEDGLPRHAYRGFPGDHFAVTRTRQVQAVTGACLLATRAAFLPGGFDTSFQNGFEDVDLCLRVRSHNGSVVYCGSVDATHLESVSVNVDRDAAIARHSTNTDQFLKRWDQRYVRDEIQTYIDDGLIRIRASDVYPLRIHIAPELGTMDQATRVLSDMADLLDIRARQVFDLQKDVGVTAALRLDQETA